MPPAVKVVPVDGDKSNVLSNINSSAKFETSGEENQLDT